MAHDGRAPTLGLLLLAKRRSVGCQQRAVADRLGVSQQTYSKWERDDMVPDLAMHGRALAKWLGISLARLELAITLGIGVPDGQSASDAFVQLHADLDVIKRVLREVAASIDHLNGGSSTAATRGRAKRTGTHAS